MPPSSQSAVGRPRLKKESSSSSQQSGNRNIRDFFKPFTIPRNRIPVNDVVEEEIVVAVSSPKRKSVERSTSPLSSSPAKSQSSVGQGRAQHSSRTSTPTKGRRSPVKSTTVPQLDGAGDAQDLLHESPPSSQQRVMTAVEIPTPTRMRSPAPPPPPAQAETNTSTSMNTANMSFNSMSSLTSVPLSSQASSSRRILKNGIPLVTNSDSGSAEDSEDELQDIVIPRKKMRMTPPPGEDETTTAIEAPSTIKPPPRTSGRLSAGKKSQGSIRSHTPRRRLSPEPPRAANMSSLLQLVREKEKREKAEAKIREAETAFETEQKVREEKLRKERDLGGGLKALVADDSDEGERMMLAVERTEAMGGEVEDFFYFQGIKDDVPVREPRADDITAFAPWEGAKFARLKGVVLDPQLREQAVLSGFLAEVAGKYGLPPELMDWMCARLVREEREEREEVREGYVGVFRRYLEGAKDMEDVHRMPWVWFNRVYRTVDDVASGEESESRGQKGATKTNAPPPGLRDVVRVVQYACSNATSGVANDSILDLALAGIDTHVSKDAELKSQLHESMAAIMDSMDLHGIDITAHTVFTYASGLSLPLRCRLIASLPASTEKCHRLRRLLALHLIADKPVPEPADDDDYYHYGTADPDLDPSSPEWITVLLSRLRSAPEWHISESTDYTHLNALIPILDIALDAGFSSPPPTSITNGTAASNPNKAAKAPSQSNEEKAFNAQIDAFTDIIRQMSARIRDAGTSHLRRTEAKSALERVVVRLEHCVRTRPRPRKGVFGGAGGQQRGLMGGFLGKGLVDGAGDSGKARRKGGDGKKARHPDDRVTVVPEDRLSERGGDSEREDDGDGDAGGGAEEGVEEGEDEF